MASLVHRNTSNSTAKRWISVSTCWHLDTWFYTSAGTPYLVVRTGNGLGVTDGLAAYELELGAFGLWERGRAVLLESLDQLGAGEPFLITSPVARQVFGSADAADGAFKSCVQPLGNWWPRGTYPRRSIRHHMLAPVYVADPCDQFRNLYAETGRAERDLVSARGR